MSDKKLSFITLLHTINYKKFKFLKKRSLLCNFNLFKSFLPLIKYAYYYSHKRLWFPSKSIESSITPLFFIKRMFGRKNDLLDFLDTANIQYFFKNGRSYNNQFNSKYFFKTVDLSSGGVNIVLSKNNTSNLNTGFLHKTVRVDVVSPDFNSLLFFNITMCNIVELYSIIILLHINCFNIKNG